MSKSDLLYSDPLAAAVAAANEIAKKYFSGGGHRNAAGGSSVLSLEDTVAKFLEVLPEYEY